MRAGAGSLVVFLGLVISGQASAEWKEYVYRDLGIAKEFPAEPKRETGEYKTEVIGKEGVPAVILTAEADNVVFRMTVADLQKPEFIARSASIASECIFLAEEDGNTLANMTNRVEGGTNAVYGRLTSVDLSENKGRKQTTCLFTKGRLYKIEAHVLPAHGEPNSSMAIRFTNSLRFNLDRNYGEPEGGG